MKTLLFIILIIVTSLSSLLFHDKGNELLKPYLSSYLNSKIKKDIYIEVQELKIDIGHIEATALINKTSQLKTDGDFSLLNQTVDLNYQLLCKGFETKRFFDNKKFEVKEPNLKEPTLKKFHLVGDIDVNGTAKGSIENMDIEGKGDAFEFNIAYNFILNKEKVHALKLNIDKADIEKILTIGKQPSYAKGNADIEIHIPVIEKKISKGTVDIKLYETLLNEKVLHKELNVTVPPNTKLTAKINSRFNSNILKFQGDIKSNIGVLSFKDANYDLENKKLNSDYQLNIKEPTYHYPLAINGKLEHHNKQLILNGDSSSLGGITQLSFKENQLTTIFKGVHMEKMLQLLGEKPYATGLIHATIEINDIKAKKGNFIVKSTTLTAIKSTLKEEFDIRLVEPLKLKVLVKGEVDKNIMEIKAKLVSNIANFESHKMQYNLKTNSLKTRYNLNFNNLKKLRPLVNHPLVGQLKIQGDLKKDKHILINATTKSLGGAVNFHLKNDNFRAELQSISIMKLMQMLNYPETFKGKLLGNIDYNLKEKKGKIDTKLQQAQLLPNEMTEIVKQLKGVDLTKERYNHSSFVAKINNPIIDFNFQAKSKTTNISIHHASLNQATKSIDAKYTLIIEKKDISGRIKGDVQDPKITINSSKFIQKEIEETMEEFGIGEEQKQMINDTMKEIGIGEEEKEMIKDIFKKLF